MSAKKTPKQNHSWTFRKDAVEQYRLSGKSAVEIATQLRIPAWKLRGWIKEFAEEAERAVETDELERLRAEVKRVKENNDLQKRPQRTLRKNNREVCIHRKSKMAG